MSLRENTVQFGRRAWYWRELDNQLALALKRVARFHLIGYVTTSGQFREQSAEGSVTLEWVYAHSAPDGRWAIIQDLQPPQQYLCADLWDTTKKIDAPTIYLGWNKAFATPDAAIMYAVMQASSPQST